MTYMYWIWYLVECLIWYMLYVHAFSGARATKMQVRNSSCFLTQLIYVWQYCACSMKIYEHARRGEQDKWSPLTNTCYVLFLAVCWVLLCTPVVRMQPHQLPVGDTSNNLERAALSTGKWRNHEETITAYNKPNQWAPLQDNFGWNPAASRCRRTNSLGWQAKVR